MLWHLDSEAGRIPELLLLGEELAVDIVSIVASTSSTLTRVNTKRG